MKKIIILMTVLSVLAGCATFDDPDSILGDIAWELTEELESFDGNTLAVYPFNYEDEEDRELVEYIRQILTTEIANASAEEEIGITVLSRRNMDQLMEEQAFHLSDITSENSRIEIGEVLGADLIVTGEMSWTYDYTTTVNIQVVEVESGEVLGGWIQEIYWGE